MTSSRGLSPQTKRFSNTSNMGVPTRTKFQITCLLKSWHCIPSEHWAEQENKAFE